MVLYSPEQQVLGVPQTPTGSTESRIQPLIKELWVHREQQGIKQSDARRDDQKKMR